MEHPCYRCGGPVNEGSPFCKHCGAPQIRVDTTAEEMKSEPAKQAARPVPVQAPPISDPTQAPPAWQAEAAPQVRRVGPSPIHWSRAFPVVFLAAVIEAVFSFLGIGILAGGFLSVSLYRRREPGQFITGGMGARLGAVAGGLAFFIVSIASSVGILVFHTGNQFRDAMMKSIEQAAARNPNPQAQQMLDYLRSPDGFAMMLGFGLLLTLVFYLVISMLGGMLAAGMANRRQRR